MGGLDKYVLEKLYCYPTVIYLLCKISAGGSRCTCNSFQRFRIRPVHPRAGSPHCAEIS